MITLPVTTTSLPIDQATRKRTARREATLREQHDLTIVTPIRPMIVLTVATTSLPKEQAD